MKLWSLSSLLVVLSGCATHNVWTPESLEDWSSDRWEQTLDPIISDHSQKNSVTVLIFGDSGKRRDFLKTAPHMNVQCESKCDFAVMLGDNFYPSGPASPDARRFRTRFYEPLEGHLANGFDVWVVLGNHGYYGLPPLYPNDPKSQLHHTFLDQRSTGPDWLMPAHRYRIPKLPPWIQLVGFDSQWLVDSRHFDGDADLYKSESTKYLDAVNEELRHGTGWRVLFGHHPLLTTGHHLKDEDQIAPLRDLFGDQNPFHIYFAGHDHDQQVIKTSSYLQIVQGAASKDRKNDPREAERVREYRRLVSLDTYWKSQEPRVGFCSDLGFGIATFTESSFEYTAFAIGESGELRTSMGPFTWVRDGNDIPEGEFSSVVTDIKNLCPEQEGKIP